MLLRIEHNILFAIGYERNEEIVRMSGIRDDIPLRTHEQGISVRGEIQRI